MAKLSETDKAIRNLMNWAQRPGWSAKKAAVFDAHLAPVLAARANASINQLRNWLARML
jgi:hypothetical protein